VGGIRRGVSGGGLVHSMRVDFVREEMNCVDVSLKSAVIVGTHFKGRAGKLHAVPLGTVGRFQPNRDCQQNHRHTERRHAESTQLIVLFALITSIGCSSSNLGRGLNVAVVGAAAADVVSTHHAIEAGGREWNPLIGAGWLRQAAKALGASFVIGAAAVLETKGRPVLAHLVRGVAIGIWSAAAIHNWRLE
jgi:hypothetical protein